MAQGFLTNFIPPLIMLTPTVFSYTLDPLQVLLPITLRSARCWGVNSAADERVVVLIGVRRWQHIAKQPAGRWN